jgi:hypothetical protein
VPGAYNERQEEESMNARYLLAAALAAGLATPLWSAAPRTADDNPAIDMAGHLRISEDAARHRATRRVSEADFIRMSRQPGTLVLDARSAEKFEELHVKGAVNLSFPDITVDSLARLAPDKDTRILIYCNNNFHETDAFPRKAVTAALNLSTYITLYDYGYRNVFELAPLLDVETSHLEFEGRPRRKR